MDTNRGTSSGMFGKFKSNKYLSGTKDFLSSNSLLAKFAFLLLVIIVFIVLLQGGIYFLTWLFSPSQDPILLKCMQPGKESKIIYSNPNLAGANSENVAPILRSKNDRFGLEYTWATWLYIDPSSFSNSNNQMAKHIFSKSVPAGNSSSIVHTETDFETNRNITYPDLPPGIAFGNGPGVYLINRKGAVFETSLEDGVQSKSSIVNLLVVTDVLGNGQPNQVIVEDIPLSKWMHLAIRVKNQRQMDIYINGYLSKRTQLPNVVSQNQGNVYINAGAGQEGVSWDGLISDLRYYNYALGTNQIMALSNAGPYMTKCSGSMSDGAPPYLSTRWYFSDAHDMYNP